MTRHPYLQPVRLEGMNMLLIAAWLMLGCTVGVVAMSLAIMGKSADKKEFEGIKALERGRALR